MLRLFDAWSDTAQLIYLSILGPLFYCSWGTLFQNARFLG